MLQRVQIQNLILSDGMFGPISPLFITTVAYYSVRDRTTSLLSLIKKNELHISNFEELQQPLIGPQSKSTLLVKLPQGK